MRRFEARNEAEVLERRLNDVSRGCVSHPLSSVLLHNTPLAMPIRRSDTLEMQLRNLPKFQERNKENFGG
jgi:hypothetical protein